MAKKGNDDESGSDYLELKGFLSFLILHELSLKNLCGDELSNKIGQRKKGPLTPGTIYPALKRLRKRKLLVYRRQGRKKVYFLTEQGKSELDNLYALFSTYFYGLKNKILRKPLKKKATSTKK
ncbi:PadR family transcriptional regulator [Candidatus Woesearchaeota archaeon]|nr:PadR family transcriptional regulator [Candidatus Woesearchaeota archaeon]